MLRASLRLVGCLVFMQVFTVAVTERARMCFYTTWSAVRYRPDNIDVTLCTHIIFAFADVDVNGNNLTFFEHYDDKMNLLREVVDLKNDPRNPNLKVFLAVGGYEAGPYAFEHVALNNQWVTQFIDNTATFLRQHDLDGLDVDWEFPNRNTKLIYQRFIQSLWDGFHDEARVTGRERLQLLISASANHEIMHRLYNPPFLSGIVDYILLLTYDYWGPWMRTLSHSSPLYIRPQDYANIDLGRFSVNITVQIWLSTTASRDKLVLGLATYGRTGILLGPEQHQLGDKYTGTVGRPGPYTHKAGILAYYEVCQNLNNGWKSTYITDSRVPYAYKPYYNPEWVAYDNVQSFREKAMYVVNQRLAGVMFWSMDYDDFTGNYCQEGAYPLLSVVKNVFLRYPPGVTIAPQTTQTAPSTATTTTAVTTSKKPVVLPPGCYPPFVCPYLFGSYPDCTDCTSYYVCAWNFAYRISCPAGLYYSYGEKVCDYPSNVLCPLDYVY